jgi:hypothetical protein
MKRTAILLLVLCSLARTLSAATAHDLRHRFAIDGSTADFLDDEWVLDDSTPFRERPGDSRWGLDNDIAAIAVSWDDYNLYAAVPAATNAGTLMLFLDTMCGGAPGLATTERFRRNVEFGGLTPNFLLQVSRSSPVPFAAYLDCTRPMNLVEDGAYRAVYLQDGLENGALEVAIPWEVLGDFERGADGVRLPEVGAVLSLLAIVTGGEGTGAGDAAPDPSVVLEDDSTRTAVCDNHVILPLDQDGDGILDVGVSPRSAARYAVSPDAEGRNTSQVFALRIPLEKKLLLPNYNEPAVFPVALDTRDYAGTIYLTVTIYSSDGRVVRKLREEAPSEFASGVERIEWDYEDDHGGVVGGGIYIVAAAAGAGRGAPKNTVKAAFAVAR